MAVPAVYGDEPEAAACRIPQVPHVLLAAGGSGGGVGRRLDGVRIPPDRRCGKPVGRGGRAGLPDGVGYRHHAETHGLAATVAYPDRRILVRLRRWCSAMAGNSHGCAVRGRLFRLADGTAVYQRGLSLGRRTAAVPVRRAELYRHAPVWRAAAVNVADAAAGYGIRQATARADRGVRGGVHHHGCRHAHCTGFDRGAGRGDCGTYALA